MSYSKQTWVNGEVITAAKLNHMEDGIAGAGGGSPIEPLEITITYDDDTGTDTANKTYDDFSQEWGYYVYDHPEELPDLDKRSVPCTITYVEHYDDEDQPTTTVYNGIATPAPYSDADGGVGLGLIGYLEGAVEYNEDFNAYKYVTWAYGFIFYQHEGNDVIIEIG